MIALVLRKGQERANHKYIKKIGDQYFYTQEELNAFKLTKKADGFFYAGNVKITNDPEKAKVYEEKMKEGKSASTPTLKTGQKVQIKTSHKGSIGRGIVGVIKEIGEDFVRVANEAGKIFRVPASALAYAKSIKEKDEYIVFTLFPEFAKGVVEEKFVKLVLGGK